MSDRLVIVAAQLNPLVGDMEGNIAGLRRCREDHGAADLIVAGELAISGYPAEDLVLKPSFLEAVRRAAETLAAETGDGGPALLVGAPWRLEEGDEPGVPAGVYNAALLLDGGEIRAVRCKHELPNYGVFDEVRVFRPGPLPGPVRFRGTRLGIMVCEDMWYPDVAECLAKSGAEILLVINGSPFDAGKRGQRLALAADRVAESGLPLLYVNQVGGQDELVFDGASFALNGDGALAYHAPSWVERRDPITWTRPRGRAGWQCAGAAKAEAEDTLPAVYQALVLGLRDYARKNRFPSMLIGLSGGIDSGLSAAIAVDAVGADRVHCVMMPSPYTSQESLEDAAGSAELLGLNYHTIDIAPAMRAFAEMLAPAFEGQAVDVTEENIQARARGITLMALSNKFGHLLVSTGNKSEMSVGYATLYGDMAGGFAVLKDVYKTLVYALGRWRNTHHLAGFLGPAGAVIPDRVFTKAPSAELRPDQTDQDSLPPYEELDAILKELIEKDAGLDDIVAGGFERATVLRVWHMLENAEYKRRQAPPGVKVTARSFGRDRRYPITNAFRGGV